ncbi:MAG: hypothetical protein JJV98_15805 [Desulfosarcina sp.]|nr:hypothetical protein [Desulfobacterales bacterium]
MIAHKKEFYSGAGMMVLFAAVLVVIFMPVFNGQNGLNYLDTLFNSISKGSAYYIPALQDEAASYAGKNVEMTLALADENQARQTSLLFQKGGALVNVSGSRLSVSGDLGKILAVCLEDTDLMYDNNGSAVSGQYGYDERQVLYNWWAAGHAMESDLKGQKKFKEAKIVATVNKKAVETSYNYYRISPQNISDRIGIVIFSLVFYVAYTLWYGFAIMFMFEGWGLRLDH